MTVPSPPPAEDIYSSTYTVDWFGREGLLTRDPAVLIQLADDTRFAPFGADRMHRADVMAEWLVMRRRGVSLEEARRICQKDNPRVIVLVRRRIAVAVPGGGHLSVDQGSRLEFAFKGGLIKVTTSAGALVYGTSGQAGGDPS